VSDTADHASAGTNASDSGGEVLAVEGVTKRFGGIVAVDDVSFTLREGPITGLIGPNGAGKTTLFNLISGLHGPTSGTIRLRGERIDGRPMHETARKGVARTFQISRPFGDMTVRENLLVSNYDLPAATRDRRIEEVLETVELSHQADTLGSELSGGQQTLLEIGRVLMRDPDLVLLDEPAAGVNPALVDRITDLIERTSDEQTYMIVEHDITLVSRLCDRIVVLNDGRLIADGPLEEIQQDAAVKEAYLGE
jgi:branched-chain amino acid transport system ATP-binding protein